MPNEYIIMGTLFDKATQFQVKNISLYICSGG